MERHVLNESYEDRLNRLMKVAVSRARKVIKVTPESEFKLWEPVASVYNTTGDDYTILAMLPFWKSHLDKPLFHLRPAMRLLDGTLRVGMPILLKELDDSIEISGFQIYGLVQSLKDGSCMEKEFRLGDPEPGFFDSDFYSDALSLHGPDVFGYVVEEDWFTRFNMDRYELYHKVEDIINETHSHKEFFDLADYMGLGNTSHIITDLSNGRTIGVRICYEELWYGGYRPFIRLEDGRYIQCKCCSREEVPPVTYRDFVVRMAHYYVFLMALSEGLVEDALAYYSFTEEELLSGKLSKSYRV